MKRRKILEVEPPKTIRRHLAWWEHLWPAEEKRLLIIEAARIVAGWIAPRGTLITVSLVVSALGMAAAVAKNDVVASQWERGAVGTIRVVA